MQDIEGVGSEAGSLLGQVFSAEMQLLAYPRWRLSEDEDVGRDLLLAA